MNDRNESRAAQIGLIGDISSCSSLNVMKHRTDQVVIEPFQDTYTDSDTRNSISTKPEWVMLFDVFESHINVSNP